MSRATSVLSRSTPSWFCQNTYTPSGRCPRTIRFLRPLEADQGVFHASACCRRRAGQAPSQRRMRTLATALLGAHDSERDGSRTTRRLRALQSGQAQTGEPGLRLALFVVSRLCQARCAADRLSGRRRRSQDGFWRAEELTLDFASLIRATCSCH